MDYQNQVAQLYRSFYLSLTLMIISIIALIGSLFFVKKLKLNPEIFKRQHNQVNKIIQAVAYVGLCFLIVYSTVFVVNYLLDLPHVASGEYVIDVCEITKHDSAGADYDVENRGIGCRSGSDGRNYDLLVTYTPIRQGETYRVIYLPHSKEGVIIEKIED